MRYLWSKLARGCRGLILPAALSSLALGSVAPLPARSDPAQTVTIDAQRKREELRREVNQFVTATIVKPRGDESLLRWNSGICPLVAGMTREEGEFVLQRLSQIARAANAPLGGEKCTANLYVIVARNPAGFLNLWWRHDPRLFSLHNGFAPVRRFIETPRPVRIWYNSVPADPDSGEAIGPLLAQSVGVGQGPQSYPMNLQHGRQASRLRHLGVRAIASAIVVVDAQQVASLNFGQLADYIGLVSLAEINLDQDAGEAPSILSVFRKAETSLPQGLTAWDQALLHAVYNSRQTDRLQISEIQTATLDAVANSAP